MFVSGVCGLVSSRVVSGHVLIRICILQSASLMLLVGASCFPNLLATKSLLQFIFENVDKILQELYFFLISISSSPEPCVFIVKWHVTLQV